MKNENQSPEKDLELTKAAQGPENEHSILEDIDKSFDVTKVHQLMKSLTVEETKVIRKRFGFDGVEEDVSTIAYELGITVYKVNKIMESAFEKIKKYKILFE